MQSAVIDLNEAVELLGISVESLPQLVHEGRINISTLAPDSLERLFFLRDDLLQLKKEISDKVRDK
jgi:hypothetical protein